jgi:hypothetical protein
MSNKNRDLRNLILSVFGSGMLFSTGIIVFLITGLKDGGWLNFGLLILSLSFPLVFYSVRVYRRVK